jgi:soluble lytic murein transglycosylase
MQIMPQTGLWISGKLNDDQFSKDDLYEPEKSIKYGCWYLGWLKDKFNSKRSIVLAAYNGGHGNVDKWLNEKWWDGKEENINQIPLSETRAYVNKVLKIYRRYQYIYED